MKQRERVIFPQNFCVSLYQQFSSVLTFLGSIHHALLRHLPIKNVPADIDNRYDLNLGLLALKIKNLLL